MSTRTQGRRRTPKREVVRLLERTRDDLVRSLTRPCWDCAGDPERILGCRTCGGSGIIPGLEHGIYDSAVLGIMMTMVVDLACELVSETADADLRAALRWARDYRIAVIVETVDVREAAAITRAQAERAAELGQRSEYLDALAERLASLPPNPTRKQIRDLLSRDDEE